MHQEHRVAERGDNQNGNTDFRRAEQAPLCACPSSRDEGPMWLYDDPYEPYVPRSIFRKKVPEPSAPPRPPPPGEPAAAATGEQEDTVEELREKLKEFVQTIMAVLRPYTDAYQAVLECCRQHSTVTTPPLKFAT